MSQKEYTSMNLYEESYQVAFLWETWLPSEVYKFHELFWKETNSPVSLQMGTILPFVSSLLGPTTRCRFYTSPYVLNLYWINIAATGSGKSQTRHKFITGPLEYVLANATKPIIDFEVNKYTRAGKNNVFYMLNG